MTINVRTKLSVKELAPELGKSVSFLYKARMAGMPMEWSEQSKCFVQTAGKVRTWLRKTKFKIIDGRPLIKVVK